MKLGTEMNDVIADLVRSFAEARTSAVLDAHPCNTEAARAIVAARMILEGPRIEDLSEDRSELFGLLVAAHLIGDQELIISADNDSGLRVSLGEECVSEQRLRATLDFEEFAHQHAEWMIECDGQNATYEHDGRSIARLSGSTAAWQNYLRS